MGAKLIGTTTVTIEVTVKRPQDAAPVTITNSSGGWTLEEAAAYVRANDMTMPGGTVINIGVVIGDPPKGTD